jgi:hypothetical protein
VKTKWNVEQQMDELTQVHLQEVFYVKIDQHDQLQQILLHIRGHVLIIEIVRLKKIVLQIDALSELVLTIDIQHLIQPTVIKHIIQVTDVEEH